MDGQKSDDPAADLIVSFEGFSAKPYRCPAGVWTIGYGSTRDYRLKGLPAVTASTPPVTQATALQWVHLELVNALATVRDIKVPLTANQEAALEDFVYNVGEGAFLRSNVLRCLRAGDYHGAAGHLMDWDTVHGAVLAGLVRRRAAERDLFSKA